MGSKENRLKNEPRQARNTSLTRVQGLCSLSPTPPESTATAFGVSTLTGHSGGCRKSFHPVAMKGLRSPTVNTIPRKAWWNRVRHKLRCIHPGSKRSPQPQCLRLGTADREGPVASSRAGFKTPSFKQGGLLHIVLLSNVCSPHKKRCSRERQPSGQSKHHV